MKPIDNKDKRDKIASALNKNLPLPVIPESLPPVDHLQDDYQASRETYKTLITKGDEAIDLMMELARDSQHPRAFEVLATLLKTQSDNNDKLLDLQKKVKVLRAPDKGAQPSVPSGVINNTAIFYGSTTDLQRAIINKNKIVDVDPVEK